MDSFRHSGFQRFYCNSILLQCSNWVDKWFQKSEMTQIAHLCKISMMKTKQKTKQKTYSKCVCGFMNGLPLRAS